MLIINKATLIVSLCLITFTVKSQVGIGTVTPDASSILDLNSTEKGFLLPRMNTSQRDLIVSPANGLMIYNQIFEEVQVNIGTPSSPFWSGMASGPDSTILTAIDTAEIQTTSLTNILIAGMTLSPPPGTYLVLFNGQYGLEISAPISTAQGVSDLNIAYNELMDLPVTNSTHMPIFGNGEVLLPGVYDLAAAASFAGMLTLDGGGDTSALFVVRTGGALSSGAGTTVVLTNGARASNIFWISEGALSLAANTTMKGTLISHNAAVSVGAGCNLEGRMFSTTGAISINTSTIYIPSSGSYIDLGVLSSFVIFTSAGAIANTEPSNITGDVGTNIGAIAGFENLNGNIYGPGSAPIPNNNTIATFSIYQNGVMIVNSQRTCDINTGVISLQTIATVTSGQTIEVKWKVDAGPVSIGNRILSLINVN